MSIASTRLCSLLLAFAAASAGVPASADTPASLPQSPDSASAKPTLELEPPSIPHRRQRPQGGVLASLHDEQLARWNLGGSSNESHPSNRANFHPAPRVVVDAQLLGAWGRTRSRQRVGTQLQAALRSKGYWSYRICHEAALRLNQKQEADFRLRITAEASGRIRAVRALETDAPGPLVSCAREATFALKLGVLPARRMDAEVRIRLWPGDACVPMLDEEPTEKLSPESTRRLSTATSKWEAVKAKLVHCATAGTRSDSRLWGRIQLWVDFDERGKVVAAREHESHFPDSKVTACALRAAAQLKLGPGPKLTVLFPVRIGSPPAPPEDNP